MGDLSPDSVNMASVMADQAEIPWLMGNVSDDVDACQHGYRRHASPDGRSWRDRIAQGIQNIRCAEKLLAPARACRCGELVHQFIKRAGHDHQGPAEYAARYPASTPDTTGIADGATSAMLNVVGATLYVTVIDPAGRIRNVPVVRPVVTPFTAITVTVPPATVTSTGTGFGFTDATVLAASVIAVVNIDGAAATTALALSRSAPASTK